MENNKIVLKDGRVLIDLTADTAEAADVAYGKTFHSKSGAKLTGTNTKDSNTMDGTLTASTVLTGIVGYSHGNKITGTMPNKGAVTGSISTKAGQYVIPMGYHDGSGKVSIATAEQDKLIPANIREGVTVLGVLGTMSGTEGEIPEPNKEVTPTFADQEITPGEGYTCFMELTVKAITVASVQNSAGGYTVTIG